MKHLYTLLLLVSVVTCSARPVCADETSAQRVLVVVGASGTEEYGVQFNRWAARWEQACHRGGAAYEAVGLDDSNDPNATADREILQQCLQAYATDPNLTCLWIVLIGHGTYDGRTAKFNLRGPDISAKELGQWLDPIDATVAIIDTSSSSAPFLTTLGAPQRIVITATKSGFEHNLTRFGKYLALAIADPAADLDKDGQTSLLEAFLKASHATHEFYRTGGRLVTEHALLDDNGDALGTPADWFRGIRPTQKAAENASLDGYRAHQIHLIPSATEAQMPPKLRARRDQLELQVMQLRDSRESMSETEYFARLEPLLVEIARIYDQAEKNNQNKNIH